MANVVIIDYGLGNLFSVKQACLAVGLDPTISCDKKDVEASEAIILPGVGAFGDAMSNLANRNLIPALRDAIEAGKPFLGICLGMQLLFDDTEEFGHYKGLGLVGGRVRRLEPGKEAKVPHIGWNRLHRPDHTATGTWNDTPLENLDDGVFMYFVHSYHVIPKDRSVVVAETRYGDAVFCSALKYRNIFAFQCHPERSGPDGLQAYRSFARTVGGVNP